MKTKQTLAICDLNAAVAAKDANPDRNHTAICLNAQFAKRVTGRKVLGSTATRAMLEGDSDYNFRVKGISMLVYLFDDLLNRPHNIAEIRRQLPMEVEVEIL